MKKVLYGIIILAIIIILAVMWNESKKEDIEPIVTETPKEEIVTEVPPVEIPKTIDEELNELDINSGIDEDIKGIDEDIKTL